MRNPTFFAAAIGAAAAVFIVAALIGNDYLFFAGYTVVQYIVLAAAWNMLGGYCGYVNFGTAAFFALGAYTTVFFHKAYPLPIPVLLVIAAGVSGLVGLGTGYLTLRLRGAFFSIATLALAVVLQTFVVNWDYVGGSRGAYVIRPDSVDVFGFQLDYVRYLSLIMLLLAAVSVAISRAIERSKLGYGFATIRDDELAAEASGVPTLRLKLIATTLSGALMGMAGAPFPYYIGYVEPASTFGLTYAVNAIAMPLIGGTTVWFGPLIGSILLGTLTQIATVTISSAVNLLLVGLLLVGFVIVAPNGLVGLIREFLRAASPGRPDVRSIGLVAVASYGFIVGVLEVVFSLAALTAPDATGLMLAFAGLVLACLWIVSAYGMMTLQRWSPLMATIAFALSIVVGAIHIWADRTAFNISLWGAGGAVAIVSLWFLQRRYVQQLYRPKLTELEVAA
ncbi:MAG TPA: branched-chain amino acid ABC transporter permease [Xanthobacteraceae bacterium]|nr:branched-chain amino acid ABC transporter permease [Xanthobacteraceae bacterium]